MYGMDGSCSVLHCHVFLWNFFLPNVRSSRPLCVQAYAVQMKPCSPSPLHLRPSDKHLLFLHSVTCECVLLCCDCCESPVRSQTLCYSLFKTFLWLFLSIPEKIKTYPSGEMLNKPVVQTHFPGCQWLLRYLYEVWPLTPPSFVFYRLEVPECSQPLQG